MESYSSYTMEFTGRGFVDAESLHAFKTHTCHSPLKLELSFLIQKVSESHITGGLGVYSCKITLYSCSRLMLLVKHQQFLTVRLYITGMTCTFGENQYSHSQDS